MWLEVDPGCPARAERQVIDQRRRWSTRESSNSSELRAGIEAISCLSLDMKELSLSPATAAGTGDGRRRGEGALAAAVTQLGPCRNGFFASSVAPSTPLRGFLLIQKNGPKRPFT